MIWLAMQHFRRRCLLKWQLFCLAAFGYVPNVREGLVVSLLLALCAMCLHMLGLSAALTMAMVIAIMLLAVFFVRLLRDAFAEDDEHLETIRNARRQLREQLMKDYDNLR